MNELTTAKMPDMWSNVEKANRGDRQALAALRSDLSGPNARLLLDSIGDLASQVENALIKASFAQTGVAEVVRAKLQAMRLEMGYDLASQSERLLIERVVQTWLHLQVAEMHQHQQAAPSVAQQDYSDNRVERLQKRHLAAVKMLATFRKLGAPSLQVNIERSQINVG
ncbi:MAG: hypothetical protein Q8M16_23805 [Pirellulaceae bacterium]|nr:hypothetical protein [Pirellulaceae bacterium]